MKAVTAKEQYDYFLDTLNSCGMFLLQCDKDEIGYCIFEKFDTDRISFLHEKAWHDILSLSDEIKSLLKGEKT